MLRGKKIIFSKNSKNNPVKIEGVVPVIASSMAGTTINIETVKKPKKVGESAEKIAPTVTPTVGSKKPATIFMIIVLVLGFYVIYDQFINAEKITDEVENNIEITKIDDTKDYIYYENEKEVYMTTSSSNKFTYKDIVININIDSIKSLNTRLNAENDAYAEEYLNGKDASSCVTPSKDLSSYTDLFTYRDYVVYESDDYITVVVKDNTIDICGNILNKTITTYVISIKEGIIYTENSLLTLYETTKKELVTSAIITRDDDDYSTLDSEDIVDEILDINEISLYIDNKECLGIYYTGIMNKTLDDHRNISLICK